MLLVWQRNSLLGHEPSRDTLNVLVELFRVDVALHIATDVTRRKLLAGTLDVQVIQLAGWLV